MWVVTGGTGFLGRFVVPELRARLGAERPLILGGPSPRAGDPTDLVRCDLRDPEAIAKALAGVAIDGVIHLAGKVPPADDLHDANVTPALNLLTALGAGERPVRFLIAGSAAEYGAVPNDVLPVSEERSFSVAGEYGIAKRIATDAVLAAGPPIEPIAARIFNLIGPGMPESLAFGGFAAQLARSRERPVRIRAGNLAAERDFIDVRDAARALVDLALRARPGRAYNVATGIARTVRSGLELLIRAAGLEVVVAADDQYRHSPSGLRSVADISRIQSEIGFAPEIDFERSIQDLWAHAAGVESG